MTRSIQSVARNFCRSFVLVAYMFNRCLFLTEGLYIGCLSIYASTAFVNSFMGLQWNDSSASNSAQVIAWDILAKAQNPSALNYNTQNHISPVTPAGGARTSTGGLRPARDGLNSQ